jgi:hypothetical protein
MQVPGALHLRRHDSPHALAIPAIPILLDGASIPRPERLPQDLESGLTRSETHRRIEIQKPRCRAGDVKG